MYFTKLVIGFIDTAFIGHINYDKNFPDEKSYDFLAAVSYTNIWIYCMTSLFIDGISIPFMALASQAMGAKQDQMVGVWFKISIYLGLILFIPTAICCYFSGEVILGLYGSDTCDSEC